MRIHEPPILAAIAGGPAATAEAALGAADLRQRLGYAADGQPLLALAGRLGLLFEISAPDAPGMAFFGAQLCPGAVVAGADPGAAISLAGAGLSPRSAFDACLGEAAEYLSQLEWGDEALERRPPDWHGTGLTAEEGGELLDWLRPGGGAGMIDWIAGRRLADDGEVLLPADLCLRRPAHPGRPAADIVLGAGVAAGATGAQATFSALLELVERDAAMLWWRGGLPARALPAEAMAEILPAFAALRRDAAARATTLLDITTDLDIPCVAAVSFHDGRGFTCGLAARPTLVDAARAALTELCQMELGAHLIEAKRRQRGDAALADADRRRLHRQETVRPGDLGIVAAGNPPAGGPVDDGIAAIEAKLRRRGVTAFAIDLTRPGIGIPASRVIATGIQAIPDHVVNARLAAARAATGGPAGGRGDIPLL